MTTLTKKCTTCEIRTAHYGREGNLCSICVLGESSADDDCEDIEFEPDNTPSADFYAAQLEHQYANPVPGVLKEMRETVEAQAQQIAVLQSQLRKREAELASTEEVLAYVKTDNARLMKYTQKLEAQAHQQSVGFETDSRVTGRDEYIQHLEAQLAESNGMISDLTTQVEELTTRNAKLEAQLGKQELAPVAVDPLQSEYNQYETELPFREWKAMYLQHAELLKEYNAIARCDCSTHDCPEWKRKDSLSDLMNPMEALMGL